MTIVLGGGDFNRILDVLEEKRNFLVLSHVHPDGDSIGSSLALGHGLRRLGKKVTLVCDGQVPELFRFLPGSEQFVSVEQVEGEFDVVVLLDCASSDRVGPAWALTKSAAVSVNIDHHATNPGFGDLNWIDVDAAATGELVYQLLSALSVNLTEEVATCIYTAIATDTGFFRFSNTAPDSFLVAGHCVAVGVRPDKISEAIHASRSLASFRLQEAALATLAVHGDGLVATLEVTRAMRTAAGAAEGDTEGLVSLPRSVAGVEVAVLLRETDVENEVRASFRSRGKADVSVLAGQFGGGGHARAAGCSFHGTMAEAVATIVPAALAFAQEAIAMEEPSPFG